MATLGRQTRDLTMSENRQRCPHCGDNFVLPQPCDSVSPCPSCGKTVAAPGVRAGKTEWYFARGKKKIGPVSAAQMKKLFLAGKLTAGDKVLQSGAQKWTVAGEVKEFFPRVAPPIVPTASPPTTCTADKTSFDTRHEVLSESQVVPEAQYCVQCGMCSYNCPMEIDVRAHAWRGIPIRDSHCLTCSECVNRCPRGVLRFERIPLFIAK